jgi:plastocyanin
LKNRLILVAAVLTAVVFSPSSSSVSAVGASNGDTVLLIDDCDPNADWAAVGGCQPSHNDGNVTLAEFNVLVSSPRSLNPVFVGHPSWRIEPGYLTIQLGDRVKVRNYGGRNHTFTRVAQFGAGIAPAPPLNAGFSVAPECTTSEIVAPGDRDEAAGLSASNGGVNRYQCCFHPWMRAVIKVAPDTPSKH